MYYIKMMYDDINFEIAQYFQRNQVESFFNYWNIEMKLRSDVRLQVISGG